MNPKTTIIVSGVVLVALCAPGCGPGEEGSSKGGDGGVDGGGEGIAAATPAEIERLIEKIVDATCEQHESCASTLGRAFSDKQSCVAFYGSIMSDIARTWSGRVAINWAKEAECLAAFSSCTLFDYDRSATCDEMLIGLVAEGGCCNSNDVCSTELYCDLPDEGAGICRRQAKQGGSCESQSPDHEQQCGAGLHCNSQGLCEASRADGETCERDVECSSGQCVDGQCGDLPVMGEACDASRGRECGGFALSCVQGQCVQSATVGEACRSFDDTEGVVPDCIFLSDHPAFCQSGTCVGSPAAGDDCSGTFFCADFINMYCDIELDASGQVSGGICKELTPVGGACGPEDSIPCAADAYCDEQSKTCVATASCQ